MRDPTEALKRLNMAWPEPPKALAAYAPAVRSGPLLFVSGQLPVCGGELRARGAVPSRIPAEDAARAAERCALNALSLVAAHVCGDWSKVRRIVRLGVFVQSDPGFGGQPAVADGASRLLAALFGDEGLHARAAVGVSALPLDAAVELELIAEIGS